MSKLIEYFTNKWKLSEYFLERKYKKIEPNLDQYTLIELKNFEWYRFKYKDGDYLIFNGKLSDKIISFLENNENVKVFIYKNKEFTSDFCAKISYYTLIAWGNAIESESKNFKEHEDNEKLYERIHFEELFNKKAHKIKESVINKYPINLMLTNCKQEV